MGTVINLEDVNAALSDASVVKSFFKAEESTGDITVTDAQSGIVVASEAITNNGDGSIVVDVGANTALTTGSWTAPGAATDFAVWGVAIRTGTFDSITIGSGVSNHSIAILFAGSGNSAVIGATGTANLSPITSAAVQKFLLTADHAGDFTLYTADIGAAFAATALTPTYATSGNVTTMDSAMSMYNAVGSGGFKTWGTCYAVFPDDLPADMITIADWMCEEMYLNNKDIYPRLTEI